MGVVDGSKGTWKPFVDKVPKQALDKKRTFLPKTAPQFKAPTNLYHDDAVSNILHKLKQAETLKTVNSPDTLLKDSLGETSGLAYKQDKSVMKPVKHLSKTKDADSLRWPFGKPSYMKPD